MASKSNIPSDSFIPEGLEFKQEYLDNALAMYKVKKRAIWWRKMGLWTGSVLLIMALGALVNSNHKSEQTELEKKIEEVNALANGDNKVAETKSEANTKTPTENLQNKSGVSENGLSPQGTSENEGLAELPEGNGLQSKVTFDHGNPTSSGVGLPGQKSINISNSEKKKVSPEHAIDEEIPLLNAPKLIASESKEQEEIASQTGYENADDVNSNNETDSNNPMASDRINYLPASWQLSTPSPKVAKPIVVEKWKRLTPYVQVGLSPIASYGSSNRQWKPDPIISAGAQYQFHHGLALNTELRYYSISGLSHPYEVSSTKYGQGFEVNTETYYTDRLHYGGLQLGLTKTLHQNHVFLFGFATDYLITGNNHITSSLRTNFENTQTASRKVNGYVKGFQNLNQSLVIGYQFKLGANKSVGLNYQFGLTDITNDKYFVNGTFDRNSMLSIYFRLNLHR
jgi:hypothetical protein